MTTQLVFSHSADEPSEILFDGKIGVCIALELQAPELNSLALKNILEYACISLCFPCCSNLCNVAFTSSISPFPGARICASARSCAAPYRATAPRIH